MAPILPYNWLLVQLCILASPFIWTSPLPSYGLIKSCEFRWSKLGIPLFMVPLTKVNGFCKSSYYFIGCSISKFTIELWMFCPVFCTVSLLLWPSTDCFTRQSDLIQSNGNFWSHPPHYSKYFVSPRSKSGY